MINTSAISRAISEMYGKVVVASKVPLPNYKPDLDDKWPQWEFLQLHLHNLMHQMAYDYGLRSQSGCRSK
ncbi:hypothetical protein GQ457_10G010630 [Hibiscus cannabinus]